MERLKRLARKLFKLRPAAMLTVSVLGFGLVFYVLAARLEHTPIVWIAYPLFAYALIVCCVSMKDHLRALRKAFDNSNAKQKLMSHPVTERLLSDELFRLELGQYRSLFVDLIFAAIKLVAGILFRSRWFLVLAVYYSMLALMRTLLFRRMSQTGFGNNITDEWKRCLLCGVALLLTGETLIAIVVLMLKENDSYHYPGILIYLMVLYCIYAMVAAIRQFMRTPKQPSPVLYASRTLNGVAALTSVLALETALMERFGSDVGFRRIVVGCTGAVVCLFTVSGAVVMIARSLLALKRIMDQHESRSPGYAQE